MLNFQQSYRTCQRIEKTEYEGKNTYIRTRLRYDKMLELSYRKYYKITIIYMLRALVGKKYITYNG